MIELLWIRLAASVCTSTSTQAIHILAYLLPDRLLPLVRLLLPVALTGPLLGRDGAAGVHKRLEAHADDVEVLQKEGLHLFLTFESTALVIIIDPTNQSPTTTSNLHLHTYPPTRSLKSSWTLVWMNWLSLPAPPSSSASNSMQYSSTKAASGSIQDGDCELMVGGRLIG